MIKVSVFLVFAFMSCHAHVASAQELPDTSIVSEETKAEATVQSDSPTKAGIQVPRSVIQLETSAVKGSQELPKVLVIVPWKSAQVVENEDRPLASLVEEILSPLDPAVFRRQTNYYNSLQQPDDEKAPAK